MKIDYTRYNGLVYIDKRNKDTGASNGAGGSTSLIEAVCFGLFGKTVRKSKDEAIINSDSGRNCKIEIRVRDSATNGIAKIIRTKRPTSLKFFWGDKNLTQESVMETQKMIDEMLGINYKTFLSSSVFGQHNTVEFLNGSAEEKRLIIRKFLNLDDVFLMRDKIKNYKSDNMNEMKRCDAVLNDTNEQLKSISEKLDKIQNLKDELFVRSGYTSKDLEKHTLKEIIELDNKEEKLICDQINIYEERISLDNEILELKTKIKKGVYEQATTCFACGGQTYDKQSESDIGLYKTYLDNKSRLFSKLGLLYEQYSQDLKELPEFIPLKDYKKIEEYNELKKESKTLESFQEKFEKKIKELEDQKKDASKNYEVMRFWEIAFSEQGIIQYIIRNVLDFFNEKVNYYLSLIDEHYMIHFNESLEEKIFINGKFTYYISLSGGEKKKCDLAILLALQDLLKLTNSEQSNVAFFDEIADNLDSESIKNLYILLQELAQSRTIFCITHNKYLKDLLSNEQKICLEKKNGVTKKVH